MKTIRIKGLIRVLFLLVVITLTAIYQPSSHSNVDNTTIVIRHPHVSGIQIEELQCLSRAVFYESRNQPLAGQYAVAAVVWNRHLKQGKSLCQIVSFRTKHTCAFSYQCQKGLVAVARDPISWARAVDVATEVILRYNRDNDITHGATYFHEKHMKRKPGWTKHLILTASIGDHLFYAE